MPTKCFAVRQEAALYEVHARAVRALVSKGNAPRRGRGTSHLLIAV